MGRSTKIRHKPRKVPGAPTVTRASSLAQPIIEIKQLWGGEWLFTPSILMVSAGVQAGGRGISELRLRRDYGPAIKQTYTPLFQPERPLDIIGWWVRLSMVSDTGTVEQFVGRIESEPRRVYSNDTDAQGVQEWLVLGPLQLLAKIHVANSVWWDDGAEKSIGWLPAMNVHDDSGDVLGNRSTDTHGGVYVYGEKSLWTRRQYIDYLLTRFADASAYGGPGWVLSGQTALLDAMTDSVRFGDSPSILDMLRKLIPTGAGLDFRILTRDVGFEVNVFALNGRDATFNGQTLLKNPNTFNLNPAGLPEGTRFEIVSSNERQYDRITLQGARIKVCASVEAEKGDLVAKWSTTLEDEYKNPGPTDAQAADEARAADVFAPVYGHFGIPIPWDHLAGAASLATDTVGALLTNQAHQSSVKSTLELLPVREGDGKVVDHEADDVAAAVFARDEERDRWVPVDAHGVNVEAARRFLGVKLGAAPRHRLARGHWSGAADSDFDPADVDETGAAAGWDYEKLVAAVAWRSDHRLRMHFELTDGTSPIGDHLIVTDESLELWVILPGTAVGVDENGNLIRTSGMTIVRNDADRMAMIMAGLIARHHFERVRAQITLEGFWPVGGLVGNILSVIEQGPGQAQPVFVHSPVTSVEWYGAPREGATAQTIIRTGY